MLLEGTVINGNIILDPGPCPPEGARVKILILTKGKDVLEGLSAAATLAAIASLPTAGGDPFTSRDHDKIFYGDGETR